MGNFVQRPVLNEVVTTGQVIKVDMKIIIIIILIIILITIIILLNFHYLLFQ